MQYVVTILPFSDIETDTVYAAIRQVADAVKEKPYYVTVNGVTYLVDPRYDPANVTTTKYGYIVNK